MTAPRIRHYDSVKVGEVIHAYGVPLTVVTPPTPPPTIWNRPTYGDHVVSFTGEYQGPDLPPESGLWPFVRLAGDTWTFQRADWCADLASWDDGETWQQRT